MKSLLAILMLLSAVVMCVAETDTFGFPEDPSDEDRPLPSRPERPVRPSSVPERPVRPPSRPERPVRPTTSSTPAVPTPDPNNPGIDGNGALIGCNCPSTSETNLVCGTDGNTYGNMGKLKCAQRCGHNVEVAFLGNCRARPS